MSREPEPELEAEIAAEFAQESAASSKKRPDHRAKARELAQAASSVARDFLAAPIPEELVKPDVVPVEALPAPTVAALCGCGVELGHAVYGVHTGGRWYCPTCYMREARDHSLHPVARAIDCPTCHRQSVDFAGRNQCPICRARGARPIRMN